MICSFCLDDIRAAVGETPKKQGSSEKLRSILRVASWWFVVSLQLVSLILVTWSICAFLLDRLEKVPADFHDGTVWEEGVFQ